jgi:hypothetical protein
MHFPHNGKIMTINQLSFVSPDLTVDHLTCLNVPYMKSISLLPQVNYVVSFPLSPTYEHHVRVKSLASSDHVGGKVPTFGHHVGKKPVNGYHSKYQPLDIMLGRNSSMGIILSIVHFLFQAR